MSELKSNNLGHGGNFETSVDATLVKKDWYNLQLHLNHDNVLYLYPRQPLRFLFA